MKSISYDINPGGDVELILKKPNKQNIVPESPTFHGNPVDPEFPNSPCLGRYQVFSELYLVVRTRIRMSKFACEYPPGI
jgi:hypothetical protein